MEGGSLHPLFYMTALKKRQQLLTGARSHCAEMCNQRPLPVAVREQVSACPIKLDQRTGRTQPVAGIGESTRNCAYNAMSRLSAAVM